MTAATLALALRNRTCRSSRRTKQRERVLRELAQAVSKQGRKREASEAYKRTGARA